MKRSAPLSRSSGLKQRTPMKRNAKLVSGGTGLKKSGIKRSQPRRDWTEARAKVEEEGNCRFYGFDLGCAGPIEAAHIIGREVDRWGYDEEGIRFDQVAHGGAWWVMAERIVPLCKFHHDQYDGRDQHRIDLLPALTLEEQLQAVRDADGLENARVRTAPSQYGRVRHGDDEEAE